VAYFYCIYRESNTNDPLVVLGSLAKQLAVQAEECFAKMEKFYKRHYLENNSADPTPVVAEDLCALLRDMSSDFDSVSIIVDALDECGANRYQLTESLISLNDSEASNIRTIFSSRNGMDIRMLLKEHTAIPIAATNSDLRLYVASQIEVRTKQNKLRTRDPELKNEIMDRLIEGAEGM
jgi:hypothetical protein